MKDKEGYMYGGYASQAWERHGDFYGDLKSFLFQLYPKAAIYKPTGANNNIQWVTSPLGFLISIYSILDSDVYKSCLAVCSKFQFR